MTVEAIKTEPRLVNLVFMTFFSCVVIALYLGGLAEKLPLGLLLATLAVQFRPGRRGKFLGECRNSRARLDAFAINPESTAIPWSDVVLWVTLPFIAISLAHGKLLGAIDTRPVVPTALALVSSATWSLDQFRGGAERRFQVVESPAGDLRLCFQKVDDHIYSAFPLGMVPVAVLPCTVAVLLGLDVNDLVVHFRLEKLTSAVVGAICLTLFFLIGCCLSSVQSAAFVTFFLATGSAILTTVGIGLWQHGGVILWLLTALLVEFRSHGRPGMLGGLLQGIALGQMLSCRPTAALLVGLFVGWVLMRSVWRGLALGAICGVAFVPWLLLNLQLYHHLLGPATIRTNTSGQLWHFFRLPTMLGVLVCPARGLLVYQPWSVLVLGWLLPSIRRTGRNLPGTGCQPPGWAIFCALGVGFHTFLISAWYDWSGGYCWGSRLLSEIIPLVGLLVIPVAEVLRQGLPGKTFLLVLLLISPLPHLPCLFLEADRWNYVTDHDDDLWSWPNAPFFYRGG